jgi:hypothetical protein
MNTDDRLTKSFAWSMVFLSVFNGRSLHVAVLMSHGGLSLGAYSALSSRAGRSFSDGMAAML